MKVLNFVVYLQNGFFKYLFSEYTRKLRQKYSMMLHPKCYSFKNYLYFVCMYVFSYTSGSQRRRYRRSENSGGELNGGEHIYALDSNYHRLP